MPYPLKVKIRQHFEDNSLWGIEEGRVIVIKNTMEMQVT